MKVLATLLPVLFVMLWHAGMVANAADMTFREVGNGGNCYDGCEWVVAEGTITKETPALLEKFLTIPNPETGSLPVKRLHLHSPGGNLGAALLIGRFLRAQDVTVTVSKSVRQEGDWGGKPNPFFRQEPGECLSACAYMFLGGAVRKIPDGSKIGFHQFYGGDMLEYIDAPAFTGADRLKDQAIIGLLIEYLVEMGVDVSLYPMVAGAGPNSMTVLAVEDIVRLRIDNDRDPSGDWSLKAFGKGLVAEVRTQRTGRRLRLYCSSSGSAHLAFFIPDETGAETSGAGGDPDTGYRAVFDGKGLPSEVFGTGFSAVAEYNQEAFNADTGESILVLDIPVSAARKLAESDAIWAVDGDHTARVVEPFYQTLYFGGIGGDARLAKAALSNCI